MTYKRQAIRVERAKHLLTVFFLSVAFTFNFSASAMGNSELSMSLNDEARQKIMQTIKGHNVKNNKASLSSSGVKQNTKLSYRLSQLLVDQKTLTSAKDLMLKFKSDNMVQVYIEVANASDGTKDRLKAEGVEVDLVHLKMNMVQGWVSTDQLAELASKSWVVSIKEPVYPNFRVGSRTTEGDVILRSNLVRDRGVTGRGVKVGILSNGADNWPQAAATGDLPNNFTTFGVCASSGVSGTCDEGTAMAEIIHDIAPNAELAVAAIGTSMEFIVQLEVLASTFEADVIVDDIGFFGEPYFEDGPVAQAVSALPEHILYFSSAGNQNQEHYQAGFDPEVDGSVVVHDFDSTGAVDVDQGFAVGPNSTVSVFLQWNESFENPTSDYDLFVFDIAGNLVALSATVGPNAIEAVGVSNSSSNVEAFFAVVQQFSGVDREIEMFHLGALLEREVSEDAIFGHPATERAIAVAAIDAADAGNDTAQDFSSRGPSTVFRPQFQVRNKPDIAAIDGVSVTGAGGFPSTFFGTSAAAPHAAGVAALLLSGGPFVTPEAVREALTSTAIGGRNTSLGFGRVDANLAFDELATGNPLPAIQLLLDEED